MKMSKKPYYRSIITRNAVGFSAVFVALSSTLSAAVINMNFLGTNTAPTTTTNPGYGLWGQGVNTWNLSGQFSGTNLVDSTGAATTVGYAYTGGTGRNQNTGWAPDALTNQGFFNLNDSTTVGILTLSGLTANQAYELLVFHPGSNAVETETANALAPVNFTGSTSTTGGATYTDAFDGTTPNHFWYYSSVVADGSGQIVIQTTGAGHDVLTGFQIQSIPEPSLGLLSCLGALGLMFRRRR